MQDKWRVKADTSNKMLSVNFNREKSEENNTNEPKKDPYYFTFFNEKNEGERPSEERVRHMPT